MNLWTSQNHNFILQILNKISALCTWDIVPVVTNSSA